MTEKKKGKIIDMPFNGNAAEEREASNVMCCVLLTGEVVIYQDKGILWEEPCFIVRGESQGKPIIWFNPVLLYAMSNVTKPFNSNHILCSYPAEKEIEGFYLNFAVNNKKRIEANFDA